MKLLLLSLALLGAAAHANTFFTCPSTTPGLKRLEVRINSDQKVVVVEDQDDGRIGYELFDQGRSGSQYVYGRYNRRLLFSRSEGTIYNVTVEFGDGTVFNCDEN